MLQQPKPRPHQRTSAKKRLFLEGFALLRRLADGGLSCDMAERDLNIPRREWYRWLRILRECKVPLYQKNKHGREKVYALKRGDWDNLVR